jgi:predicted aspartyl protease
MNRELFYTTAFVDGFHQLCALIDPGCSAFATISEKKATKLRLNLYPLAPRMITGVIENMSGIINKVASFHLDIGGIETDNAWAYIVPDQKENLILGMPWLKSCHATLDPVQSKLTFKLHNIALRSDGVKNKQYTNYKKPLQISQVISSTFITIARKAKRNPKISVFAASLSDIEKALKPKVHLSLEEITAMLPNHYKKFASVFNPKEAATLPPHRPGIDYEMPLEKDENGKEKTVPWGPLYNMSHDELLVLRKELTNLLDKDFIRQSKSSAAAPVLFAKKPGGGLRFCVDYRGINAITRKDRYPLPLIKETLNALNSAKRLTKLDVSAAFHKIRVAKGEEWKTAFRTRYGLFEWKVCPFGLTGSPATFQRYINWALKEYLDDFCSAFVDDILVFSTGTLEDHRIKVKNVLSRLLKHGLYFDISKCEFEAKYTKYMGYIIDVNEGIKMDPDRYSTRARRFRLGGWRNTNTTRSSCKCMEAGRFLLS